MYCLQPLGGIQTENDAVDLTFYRSAVDIFVFTYRYSYATLQFGWISDAKGLKFGSFWGEKVLQT